jgi:uncharacterized protein (TIGR03089 family)
MTLSELVDALSARRGPALTWYGADGGRTELGGPVVARWVAKIANLLGTDLAGDLFDEPAPAPGAPVRVVRVDLGRSWQAVVWTAAAWLSGWEVRGGAPTDSPGGGAIGEDGAAVWVVSHVESASARAAQDGMWVLAHDLSPLALSWAGEPLPEGVLDALSDLAVQPDALMVAPDAVWQGSADGSPQPGGPDRVLIVAGDAASTTRSVLAHWAVGRSVVVAGAEPGDDGTLDRIAAQERAVRV